LSVTIRGKIVEGDYAKVERYILHNRDSNFYLVSPGGNVDEAMKIGRLFRKFLVTTNSSYKGGNDEQLRCKSPAECICASACALIWFGGVERRGTIGLHRPYINDPRFKQLPPSEASSAYRRILKDVGDYAAEMEIPQSIVETMIATSSGGIRWVDSFDRSGIDRPPSIAEWVDATCGRRSALMDMLRTGNIDNLSEARRRALEDHDTSTLKYRCIEMRAPAAPGILLFCGSADCRSRCSPPHRVSVAPSHSR
jgi:hypothetical protein